MNNDTHTHTPECDHDTSPQLDLAMLLLLPMLERSPAWFVNPSQCWIQGDQTTGTPSHICMEIPHISDTEYREHLQVITKHPLFDTMLPDEDTLLFVFPDKFKSDFKHLSENQPNFTSAEYRAAARHAYRHFPNVLATYDAVFSGG